jgi:hypothetical protein
MRILALTVILYGCGSVQTINGVRVPKERHEVGNYILITGVAFGLGYYLGNEVLPIKKN